MRLELSNQKEMSKKGIEHKILDEWLRVIKEKESYFGIGHKGKRRGWKYQNLWGNVSWKYQINWNIQPHDVVEVSTLVRHLECDENAIVSGSLEVSKLVRQSSGWYKKVLDCVFYPVTCYSTKVQSPISILQNIWNILSSIIQTYKSDSSNVLSKGRNHTASASHFMKNWFSSHFSIRVNG